MRLDRCTWPEVEAHLSRGGGVLLPVGSTEQHGPMGLIGTDTLCATAIAEAAAPLCGALVAPPLGYTPAPFNTGFPGTISISEPLFQALAAEVMAELHRQGFRTIYVLNGHGANLAPLRRAMAGLPEGVVRLRSWWEFDTVNSLRQTLYGDWEGMHATPSEIAITMASDRQPPVPPDALVPPRRLDADYIRAHAGDRHGPPDAHRRDFPDGRVGSHSALARPEHGTELLALAAEALAADYRAWRAGG
jgi:creatinine amidohydrolase